MSDQYKNIARDNAQVGSQIGRVGGNANLSGSVHFENKGTDGVDVGDLIELIRSELDRMVAEGKVDKATGDAVREDIDQATDALPADNDDSRGRFLIALKRARGLVEGLASLTGKIAEAIHAVQGSQ